MENRVIKKKNNLPVLLLGVMVIMTIIGIIAFKIAFSINQKSDGINENREYDKYYVLISTDPNANLWKNIHEGAASCGEKTDAFVEQFGVFVGSEYTALEKLDIAISAKVDGIIIEGQDNDLIEEGINKATEKGIPVVTISQDKAESMRVSFVGVNNYELGKKYGLEIEELANKLCSEENKPSVNVLVLVGESTGKSVQNILLSGIREELSNKNILNDKVFLDVSALKDTNSFDAEEEIRDIFVGENEVPDIIVCLNELHTNCVAQAVVDYNRVGRTNIIGSFASEAIINNIDKEIIYSTLAIDDKQMGEYCVTALNEYKELGYANEYYVVDTYRINKENVSSYMGGADDE